MARTPSPHPLRAHLQTARPPGATYLGRDGPVDARQHHRVVLWASAQKLDSIASLSTSFLLQDHNKLLQKMSVLLQLYPSTQTHMDPRRWYIKNSSLEGIGAV